MPRHPLIFDIETIGDIPADSRDEIVALAAGRELLPDGYAALCPPLARVVCVAWFDPSTQRLGAVFDATLCPGAAPGTLTVDNGAGSSPALSCELHCCDGEAALLGTFGRLIEQHIAQPNGPAASVGSAGPLPARTPEASGGRVGSLLPSKSERLLVTYNGRGFDLPVLIHRSIKHGVTDGRALLVKAMGENRYRPQMHVDLMDVVTFSGASSRWPMSAYAIGYGYASPKTEMHGSHVSAAVQAGRIIDVVRYCAGDVLATAAIYDRVSCLLPPQSE